MHTKLSTAADQTSEIREMLHRSVLKLRSVKQIGDCLARTGNVCAPEFRDFVSKRARGVIPTQLVEDMNGTSNNCSQLKVARRYRKADTIYANCLHEKLHPEKHKYIDPDEHAPPIFFLSSLRIGEQAAAIEPSLDFSKVASKVAKPAWYSLGPVGFNTPHVDACFFA